MLSDATSAFDALAPSYDAWYETPFGRLVDRLEKEAVLAFVEAKPGALALDLSCGIGNYALALARRGLRVVGADLAAPMLRLALVKAARAEVALHLVRADGHALPFRDGAFDLVTLVLGLEFAANPGKILGEAHRVLKPDTDLVVAILNRTGPWNLWRRLKRLFVRSVWSHARFLSLGELRQLMEEHGFSQLQSREAVYFPPFFRACGVRRLESWEQLGIRLTPGLAAFFAIRGRGGSQHEAPSRSSPPPGGHPNIEILADPGKVPLVVANDIVIGETSMYADYIFPDISNLERWEFAGSHPNMVWKVQPVRQPVIAPIPETVKVFGQETPISLEAMLLYQEKPVKAKNSMTGRPFAGVATYLPSPVDALGRPLGDEQAGYDLRMITHREIYHTKSRTAAVFYDTQVKVVRA